MVSIENVFSSSKAMIGKIPKKRSKKKVSSPISCSNLLEGLWIVCSAFPKIFSDEISIQSDAFWSDYEKICSFAKKNMAVKRPQKVY